jgi:hypothetical protein
MAMGKRSAKVEISVEVPDEIKQFVMENEESVAKEIEGYAKASTAFKDTGFQFFGMKLKGLRDSIKAKKSKFADGGWIVQAVAPHAHLVEFGHDMFDWRTGKTLGKVPPHAFLRPAKERAIKSAIAKFGAK